MDKSPLFKIPRKLFDSNFNEFKLKSKILRKRENDKTKDRTSSKETKSAEKNIRKSYSQRMLRTHGNGFFNKKKAHASRPRSQRTLFTTSKKTRPNTTSYYNTKNKYKKNDSHLQTLESGNKRLISFEKAIKFRDTKDSFYPLKTNDGSNYFNTPRDKLEGGGYNLNGIRKLRDQFGEKITKDFDKFKNDILRSFLVRRDKDGNLPRVGKYENLIGCDKFTENLKKIDCSSNREEERGSFKKRLKEEKNYSFNTRYRKPGKFFIRVKEVSKGESTGKAKGVEISTTVVEGVDKTVTKKKYFFKENFKGNKKVVKVSDSKTVFKSKILEEKERRRKLKLRRSASNFSKSKRRKNQKQKDEDTEVKTQLGKHLKFLELQMDVCEKIAKEIHNIFHIFDYQKYKTFFEIEELIKQVTLEPEIIKFIFLPHEDYIQIISKNYLFNFLFLSKAQMEALLPDIPFTLDMNLRVEKKIKMKRPCATMSSKKSPKKKKKVGFMVDSNSSGESSIDQGAVDDFDKYGLKLSSKLKQNNMFVKEKILQTKTKRSHLFPAKKKMLKRTSTTMTPKNRKGQRRIVLLPNTGRSYSNKPKGPMLLRSKSYLRANSNKRVPRKVRDIDLMFANLKKFKNINYKLVDEYSIFLKKITAMVKQLREDTASEKKTMLKHKLDKIKRVKKNLESNTETNFQDMIFGRKLVEKKLGIAEDVEKIRNKSNYFLGELVNRARVSFDELKFVSDHDFRINNLYKNMLYASGQEIADMVSKKRDRGGN